MVKSLACVLACILAVGAAQSDSDKQSSKILKDANGIPLQSLTESITLGPRGDILLKDTVLLNHIAAFDRERIPERVVHAKGAGAFGYFEVTSDVAKKYCRARIFDGIGKKTPMAIRFSTVGGEKGSADTARDPRGFAMKFYTEEGIWDLVGNNTPIFFIADPILFPSFIHTQKRNPATNLKDPNAFWDFLSLRPESIHQTLILFSDAGTPDGYRHMHGFGSHTFKNVNVDGEAVYVKYHFLTDQGIKTLSADKATELAGTDPDYATRDLYNAINNKDFPSWTAYIQVMSVDETKSRDEAFDVTKTWSEKEFPLMEIGKFTLDKTPANFFAEVEQIAFNPANMVPGIEASPDRMLQGRLFSYGDTHRHRLGPNHEQIPVNRPKEFPPQTYERDGESVIDNLGNAPNYWPNSVNGPMPNNAYSTEDNRNDAADPKNCVADRYPINQDFYTQPRGRFNSLSAGEQGRLTTNLAGSLGMAKKSIQDRYIGNLEKVDKKYADMVRTKIAAMK